MTYLVHNDAHTFVDDFLRIRTALFQPAAQFFDGRWQQINRNDVRTGFFAHLTGGGPVHVKHHVLADVDKAVHFRPQSAVTVAVLRFDMLIKSVLCQKLVVLLIGNVIIVNAVYFIFTRLTGRYRN